MKKATKKMMTGGMVNPNSPAKVSPKMKSGGSMKAMYGKTMKNGGSVLPKMKKGSGC